MLALKTTAAMERAATTYTDTDLRELLTERMQQLRSNYDGELEEIVHFLVVEPGDTPREVQAELGFSPLTNMGRVSFGDPDFTPDWEWIQCHGRWFELVYILTDDGYGSVIFIANDPGTEFDLHSLCLEYACHCSS